MSQTALDTYRVDDVVGNLEYDRDSTNPLIDNDNAWTFIADSRCPFLLESVGSGTHFGYGCDFRDSEDIRRERSAGDTVALLRVDDHGAHGGRMHRVDSIDECNAIARIDGDTLTYEWGSDRAAAYRYLDGVIEEYNSYLAGEVYGWRVLLAGDDVDSCWGYIGDADYATSEMQEAVKHAASDARDRALLRGLAQLTPYGIAVSA